MPNWLRALIAGYGAKKLGGGCFSTILVFVIIYYALGQCNHPAVQHTDIRNGHPARTAGIGRSPIRMQPILECKVQSKVK